MSISSIQFNATAEIQRRKEQIMDRKGDSAFSAVFEKALSAAGDSTQAGISSLSHMGSGAALESTDLDGIFQKASATYGVPLNLLKAVAKAESNFNPDAVSSAGAMGVMQLMPGTAQSLGVVDPYDAEQNIMGGAKYLADKLKMYDGNTELALASYNAGSGNVAKYGGVPPFPETQNYIKKIMGYLSESDLSTQTASYGNTYTDALRSFYGTEASGLYGNNALNSMYGSVALNNLGGYGGLGSAGSGNTSASFNEMQRMMLLSYQQMASQGMQIGSVPDESEGGIL